MLLWLMLKALAWWGSDHLGRRNSLTSTIFFGMGALLENPPYRPPSNVSAQVSNRNTMSLLECEWLVYLPVYGFAVRGVIFVWLLLLGFYKMMMMMMEMFVWRR